LTKGTLVKTVYWSLLAIFIIAVGASGSFAWGELQEKTVAPANGLSGGTMITTTTPPLELARAAFVAHGGEKFRDLKSVVLRGSVDLYPPNSTQGIPGGFVLLTAGDKIRLEIDARPAIAFKQIYDGEQSYSSIPGVELPPLSKFGLPVLARFEQQGYTVTAIPDKKKQRGFRISDSEGNATDFYVDPVTARVMSFLVPYNGYTFGTEHKKMKEIEGVLIPYSFVQRMEMPQGAFFAEYSVKDAKVNQPLADDVFAIPN